MKHKYFLKKINFLVILFTALAACNDPSSIGRSFRAGDQLAQGRDLALTTAEAQSALQEVQAKILELTKEKELLTHEITTLGESLQATANQFQTTSDKQKELIALRQAKIEKLRETTQSLIDTFNSQFEATMKALQGDGNNLTGKEFVVSNGEGGTKKVAFEDLTPVQKQEVVSKTITELNGIKENVETETQKLNNLKSEFNDLTQRFDTLKVEVEAYIAKTTDDLGRIKDGVTTLNGKVTQHTTDIKNKYSELDAELKTVEAALETLGVSPSDITQIKTNAIGG